MKKAFIRYEYDWDKIRYALDEETRNKNISGQMLAQEIGLSQSLYSMFMNKRRTLGRDSLHKICQYFGVPHEHWLKEVPVKEEEAILKQLELLLTTDKLPAEQKGVLNLIKDQIKSLYKEIE